MEQQIYDWDVNDPRGKPPGAQSFIKGEHMVVVVRGTVFNGGTVEDLSYDMTEPEDTEPWGEIEMR